MVEATLTLRRLRKAYGGLVVTNDVDLDVRPSEIHALIGPNGAGKSTLIGQIVGDVRPDSGAIEWMGRSLDGSTAHERVRRGIVRSFQISSILPEMSAMDNARLAALGPSLGAVHAWRPAETFEAAAEQARAVLERVGLGDRADAMAGTLSYGERRHLEIAMGLALRPRLLLLDEPMAGVGPSESKALTELLRGLRADCALLLVEHDMDVVFALADRISVLVAGAIVASGTPSEIRINPDVQNAYFGVEAA